MVLLGISLHCLQESKQQGESWIEIRTLVGELNHPRSIGRALLITKRAHTPLSERGVYNMHTSVHANEMKYS